MLKELEIWRDRLKVSAASSRSARPGIVPRCRFGARALVWSPAGEARTDRRPDRTCLLSWRARTWRSWRRPFCDARVKFGAAFSPVVVERQGTYGDLRSGGEGAACAVPHEHGRQPCRARLEWQRQRGWMQKRRSCNGMEHQGRYRPACCSVWRHFPWLIASVYRAISPVYLRNAK